MCRARVRRAPTLPSEIPSTVCDVGIRQALERERDRLAVRDRETLDRVPQPVGLLVRQQRLFGIRASVGQLHLLIHAGGRRPLSRQVRDATVVRDAEHERPLRALAAKGRERAPDRNGNLLEQIVAFVPSSCVARGEPCERLAVRSQQRVELPLPLSACHTGSPCTL